MFYSIKFSSFITRRVSSMVNYDVLIRLSLYLSGKYLIMNDGIASLINWVSVKFTTPISEIAFPKNCYNISGSN